MNPAQDSPRVLAVVVMYDSHEEVERCVRSVLGQTLAGLEVLVVDNGSRDGSGNRIRARFAEEPRVRVAGLSPYRGCSGGANAGFALALERGPAFVWLLTDDVELEPRAAEHLLQAMEADERVGLAGQYILHRDQRDRIYYGGGLFTKKGAVHEHRDEAIQPGQDPGPARDTDYATGASMFWRASALAKVGGMDESFWLYWEDADLSHRARAAGWKVVVVPRALAWHDVTPGDDPSMPLRTRYSARNELRFLRKHGLASPWAKARRMLLRGLRRRLFRGDRLAAAAAKGALDFLLGRSGPIKGRW